MSESICWKIFGENQLFDVCSSFCVMAEMVNLAICETTWDFLEKNCSLIYLTTVYLHGIHIF